MSYSRHVRTGTSPGLCAKFRDKLDTSSGAMKEPMPMDAKHPQTVPPPEKLHEEMADVLDEELELEIDDTRLAELLKSVADIDIEETLDRHTYFKELLRLQKELVRLQDWVAH